MSANRNSLLQKPEAFQKPKSLNNPTPAHSPWGHSGFGRHKCRTRAQKPCDCCFASAFVPVSDENRDGGRAFPRLIPGKADSVSPVPARIALKGRGTRGRRSDSCPCPRKKRANPGLVWPVCFCRPGLQPAPTACRVSPSLQIRSDTRRRSALAKPFQQYQETGAGSIHSSLPRPFFLPTAVFYRPKVHNRL